MTLLWIVYVPTADKMGPDLTRMGTIEDVPDELARMMAGDGTKAWPGDGTARYPTTDELAAYEEQRKVEEKADGEDLSKLLKADLEKMAADLGVDVPEGAKKADLVAAIEDHRTGLDQAHADSLAMTRTDVGTSGDPAAVIAARNEQDTAADSAGEGGQ